MAAPSSEIRTQFRNGALLISVTVVVKAISIQPPGTRPVASPNVNVTGCDPATVTPATDEPAVPPNVNPLKLPKAFPDGSVSKSDTIPELTLP